MIPNTKWVHHVNSNNHANFLLVLSFWPHIYIQRSIDKSKCIIMKKKSKGHLNFLERTKEINFFQCYRLILNEIYPFLHNPYCRHSYHVNCVFPLNAFDITILVVMTKPNFLQFNCCTLNNTPIVNITRRMNATIFLFEIILALQ